MKGKWITPAVEELNVGATADEFVWDDIPDGAYAGEDFCGQPLYGGS